MGCQSAARDRGQTAKQREKMGVLECSDASGEASGEMSRSVLAQDALILASAETRGAEGSTTSITEVASDASHNFQRCLYVS